MTQHFTPPLVKDRPTFLPDSRPEQVELWRHFEQRYRGVNVWILSDGNVVQDTGTTENENTDLSAVYPWDVNHPSAPYVTTYYVDGPTGTPRTTTKSHNPYPVAFFQGGCSSPVTAAQATLLTNYTAHGIGYGGNIS